MEIGLAVPSHQLLLPCRGKDAGLSVYICQICHNISAGSLSAPTTILVFNHLLQLDTPQGRIPKSISIKISLPLGTQEQIHNPSPGPEGYLSCMSLGYHASGWFQELVLLH